MVANVAKRLQTGVIDVIQDQGGHTKIVVEDLVCQSARVSVLCAIFAGDERRRHRFPDDVPLSTANYFMLNRRLAPRLPSSSSMA